MKFIFAILLFLASYGSALATDVTLSPTAIPNFNPSNIGGNIVVSGVTVAGSSLSCSACLRPTWVGLSGFTVSITGNQGPENYTVLYVASTSSAILAESTGLNTTTAVTFYPYVEFRIYANQAFQPLGEAYVVQPGSPGTGAWYKRYAASIVPVGGVKELRIPEIVIAATTDSPGPTNQARYTAGFYRPDNSLIQFYSCFEQFAVPPTTPSTWTALCAWNSPGGIVPPAAEAYTKPQIDARFPACTAGQMLYYNATGNVQNCLTLGTGLTITNGIITAVAATGITGSGTTGYIPKFTASSTLGNSIAREIDGLFRVDGKHLVSRISTDVAEDTVSQINFTYNPGNVTADQPQTGLQVNTTLQSGINTFVTGMKSILVDTSASDANVTSLLAMTSSTSSAGTKSYVGISSGFSDSMIGGSSSFTAFQALPPSRTLYNTAVSYVGFLNTAPSLSPTVANYSAMESTGGKFALAKKFTADEIGLKNAMPLRFYTTTALNPAQDAWVGFALGAAPATNYTYLWPTSNIMAGKHLTIDTINGTNVSLMWAAAMEAAGSDTEVQFNNAGMLSSDSRFTFSPTTGTLSVQGPVDFLNTLAGDPVTLRTGKRLAIENSLGTGSFSLAFGGSGFGNYTYYWPTSPPTTGQVLRSSGAVVGEAVNLEWASTGAGTVTSVGMTVPSTLLSVTPASITSTGTFAVTLPVRPANRIFAGPETGVDAAPTFRALVAADLPVIGTGTTIGQATMALGGDAAGDVYYRKASGALTRLAIGTTGQVLTVSGGTPAWQAPTSPITLNSTTGTIPVQSTSTSLVDSPVRVNSGNIEVVPATAGGSSLSILDSSSGGAKRVQLGTIPGDSASGAIYLGSISSPSTSNYVLSSDGSFFTELNAPGTSNPFLSLKAGNTSLANGVITFNFGTDNVANLSKNTFQLDPLAGDNTAFTVNATCQSSCAGDATAILITKANLKQNTPVLMADFQSAGIGTTSTSAGYGTRLRFGAKAGTSVNVNLATVDAVFTSVTTGQPVSNVAFSLVNGSTSFSEALRLTPTTLAVRNGSSNRLLLQGGADSTSGHPGTGQGLILPKGSGAGWTGGIGIWWVNAGEPGYNGLNGLWFNGGMNWQGENGAVKWSFRKPTDTSSEGASVIEINPDASDAFISLLPYGTSSTNTSSVRFFELAANGGSHIGLKAPDAVVEDTLYTLPNKPTAADMVLTGSPGVFSSPLVWAATSGSGSIVRTSSPTITTPTISGMLQLHTATWANRPTTANGGTWYCTDCQVTSASDNTCTGGNTTGGALAVGITTGSVLTWRCFATQN